MRKLGGKLKNKTQPFSPRRYTEEMLQGMNTLIDKSLNLGGVLKKKIEKSWSYIMKKVLLFLRETRLKIR